MLRVRGATVRFGSSVALNNLDLNVEVGEVVAVLGPSGCGKTTLLRAVAGLQALDSGEIHWEGKDLANIPVHRRDFGLMFQDHALFSHRDVAANVAFGLRMRRVSAARQRERVREMLELVGLTGYDSRSVATLSGGEAQRVALARVLACWPRLLMLDEPLGSLDRGLRDELTNQLRLVLRQLGATALHVTHDHDEAFAVADRLAVMADGCIVRIDTPVNAWRDPQREDVARFLGHENIVNVSADTTVPWGRLDVKPGRVVLRSDAFHQVSDPHSSAAAGTCPTTSASGGRDSTEESRSGGGRDDEEESRGGGRDGTEDSDGRNQINEVRGVVTDARFRGDRFELRLRTDPGSVELVVLDASEATVGDLRRYRIDTAAVAPITLTNVTADS